MEVKQKEQDMVRRRQTSQPDDTAEIEVVLESFTCFPTRKVDDSPPIKRAGSKDDTKGPPEMAASSSGSTEEPTNSYEATRRFMDKQQQNANRNRRKSFRDRFMRSSKLDKLTELATRSNSESALGVGSPARGRGLSPQQKTDKQQPTRGRSRERSRCSSRSKPSKISGQIGSSKKEFTGQKHEETVALLDAADQMKRFTFGENPTHAMSDPSNVYQPKTIDIESQTGISELSSPVPVLRQESLGTVSIQGVRLALKKMETELAEVDVAGKRVPREKIMNALNFMANTLHRDEKKKELEKELDAWIDESVIGGGTGNPGTRVDYDDDDDDDEEEEDDEEEDETSDSSYDSSFDSSTFGSSAYGIGADRRTKQANATDADGIFQDLMTRLGKFFALSDEDKDAARAVVDEMLWKEVIGVTPPTDCFRKDDDAVSHGADTATYGVETITDTTTHIFDPMACSLEENPKEPLATARGRSWWRTNVVDGGKSHEENRHPSPESHFSMPSPTGKVNPREKAVSKSPRKSAKTSSSASKLKSSKSSRSKNSSKRKSTTRESYKEPTTYSRYAMMTNEQRNLGYPKEDVDSSAFMTVGDSTAESWGLNQYSYSDVQQQKQPMPQPNRQPVEPMLQPPNSREAGPSRPSYSNHSKRKYNSNRYQQTSSQDKFASDFLITPEGKDAFDDWDDSAFHPADNAFRQPSIDGDGGGVGGGNGAGIVQRATNKDGGGRYIPRQEV